MRQGREVCGGVQALFGRDGASGRCLRRRERGLGCRASDRGLPQVSRGWGGAKNTTRFNVSGANHKKNRLFLKKVQIRICQKVCFFSVLLLVFQVVLFGPVSQK